ncbi:hypothetical protein EON64_01785 [archaeon]|nr:MAG: hypothetical protein EON64_01785 [archaeon]
MSTSGPSSSPEPSQAPVTAEPTITFAPSAAPTTSPPTLTPSITPTMQPTIVPTLQTQEVLTVNLFFTLSGLASLDLTEADKLAVRQTQAQIMNVDVRYIQYVNTTLVNDGSSKGVAGKGKQATTSGLDAEALTAIAQTAAVLPLVDFPQFQSNVSMLFQSVVSSLTTAVASPLLQQVLIQNAAELNASVVLEVNVSSSLAFGAPIIMAPPSFAPTKSPTYDDGLSAG